MHLASVWSTPSAGSWIAISRRYNHRCRRRSDGRQTVLVRTSIPVGGLSCRWPWESFPPQSLISPSSAVILEIADSTVAYDRTHTGSLYAKFGLPEYWVVDPNERRLEVYRDPAPLSDAVFGAGYRTRQLVPDDGDIAPLAVPGDSVKVAALFP
jgi:hypothetical protein